MGDQEHRERLLPYVPRMAIEWLAQDPTRTHAIVPGSMVFVDISGFTKMSERLARRGKIGAEEVTDVMNTTFGRLLEIAYAAGGGLLKFGGDALLLFFQGDRHPARAAGAAFRMRQALREGGRIATSAGAVTLRMSVGVHSGDFHFFLVGRSHRELIVTGPAASRTVEMEQTAGAGEILLSPECAALLPSACVGKPKGVGRLLRSEPPAPADPTFGGPPEVDLIELVPVAMRDHLLSAASEPEHRQATLAFIHFDGIDELILRAGPEAVARSLSELVEITQGAADEHGVGFLYADIDRDGGKIILVAGAPVATGEDEERMLRAVRAVADRGIGLPLRIGVNRGPVFAADVGAPYRRTYTVMGDAVNLAARLMARAEPGRIVVTPAVLDRSQTVFHAQPLEPFTVKGKTAPVHAVDLGQIAGVRVPSARALPFVGRKRELALLSQALGRVREGHGTIVELIGEAGIGKSRLVERLRDMGADLAFAQTSSEAYAVSTPYFTFRSLLRQFLDVDVSADAAEMTDRLTQRILPVAPQLIPWLPLIAVPLDVTVRATSEADAIDPKFRKARIHDVVSDLMGALLPSPTLIVFEDAYWMDDASRDLLLDIAARHHASPWLLCLTRRPHTAGFEAERGMPTTTIKLEPLAQDEAALLAASAAGEASLPPQRLTALTERAGGNPLFLQELVAAAATDPTMEALPESIEAVVTARIDTLAPQDRALLRYASVVGSTFSHGLVAEVLAGESVDVNADAWHRLRDFVDPVDPGPVDPGPGGRYRFMHAMFRDVAYEGLPFRRRRLLHQRTGETLERRHGDEAAQYAELLSLHFHRAQIFDKAWRYSCLAGDSARTKYANIEAAGFYRRALESARRLGMIEPVELAPVAEALGDVCELAGLYSDAEPAYEQARKLTRVEGRDRPELLMKEGLLRERAGRYTDALRWYTRGIRALRHSTGTDGTAARLTLAAAGVKLRQGRFAECIRLCGEVVRHSDRQGAVEPAQMAHAYYLLHLAHTSTGSPERAGYRGLALPIYERLGDLLGQANVLNNLGIDAYYEGRWAEALALYRRSREARERIGDAIGAIQMTNNIGEILSDQGRLGEAEALFKEVLAVCRASGYRLGVVLGSSNLARVAARAGRTDQAAPALLQALDEFRAMTAESFLLETEARIAEVAVLAGRSGEALTAADATLGRARAAGSLAVLEAMLHRLLGYAHLQQGHLVLAQDALDESLRIARGAGAAYEEALTHQAWASLAERTGHADGELHAVEAGELFENLGVVATPAIPLPGV